MKEAIFLTIQVENEVELRFPGLQRARVIAFDMSDGLRGGVRSCGAE